MEFKWQALYDRKCHCSTLIWPQGAKWKFRILTEHVQDMTNHILEYQLSTPENVDVVQVTNFTPKKRNVVLIPRDQMKIPKFVYSMTCRQSSCDNQTKTSFWGAKMKILKPYCASTRHVQSDPWIIGYDLGCGRSSSDKKFFGQTDGQG